MLAVLLCAQIALTAQAGLLDGQPVVVGAFDVALSPRVSLRPGALWANDDTLRRAALLWDLLYHGPGGAFVTVGAGMHLFRTVPFGEHDELNFGLAAGGGLERRVMPKTAIVGEATYYAVEQGRLPSSPSAFSIRVGVKHTF
jgi:hypothetical protein